MKRKMSGSLLPLFLIVCMLTGCAKEESPVLTVGDYEIYKEEFSFYCDVVKKDLIDREDTQTLYQNAQQQAAKTYALLDLAIEYKVIDRFSFEELKNSMKQENEDRSEKIARGETVMGTRQFKLEDYFAYMMADYEERLVTAVAQAPTPVLLDQAKAYYEANKESYIESGDYEYQVKTQGEDGEELVEVKTMSYEELSTSYHSKDLLGDVLYAGKIGEEYDLGDTKVTLLKRNLTYKTFEKSRAEVLTDFVIKQYLPEQIAERSEAQELDFYKERLDI